MSLATAMIDGIDILPLDGTGPDPRVGDVIVVRGWARDDGAQKLSVVVDSVAEYEVRTRLPRPDVADALHDPAAAECGFAVTLPTIDLQDGEHNLVVVLSDSTERREVARARFALLPVAPPLPDEVASASFETWTNEAGETVSIEGGVLRVPGTAVIRIDGWAADTVGAEPAVDACALVGDRIVEVAYGFERPDVAGAVGEPHAYSGFSVAFPSTYVSRTGTSFRVILLAADGLTLRRTDGALTIFCGE